MENSGSVPGNVTQSLEQSTSRGGKNVEGDPIFCVMGIQEQLKAEGKTNTEKNTPRLSPHSKHRPTARLSLGSPEFTTATTKHKPTSAHGYTDSSPAPTE